MDEEGFVEEEGEGFVEDEVVGSEEGEVEEEVRPTGAAFIRWACILMYYYRPPLLPLQVGLRVLEGSRAHGEEEGGG